MPGAKDQFGDGYTDSIYLKRQEEPVRHGPVPDLMPGQVSGPRFFQVSGRLSRASVTHWVTPSSWPFWGRRLESIRRTKFVSRKAWHQSSQVPFPDAIRTSLRWLNDTETRLSCYGCFNLF